MYLMYTMSIWDTDFYVSSVYMVYTRYMGYGFLCI